MKRYVSKITHYLIILLVFGFLFIPTCVFAKIKVPTQTNEFYVNDFADVLTDKQEKELVEKAKNYAQSNNGIQVVITTVKSLDGETLEYYAHDMYNQYKIGKDDMGVLILLVTQDRDIRMEIGTAMEAYINDAKAGRMIDMYAIDHFKKDEFAEGLIELQDGTFKEISAMVNGEERFRKLSLDEHFRLMGFHMDGVNNEILFPPTQNYTKLGRRAGNGWDVNLVGILLNHIFWQLL